MIVYKFNNVFEHIEKTLIELYGNNHMYDETVIVLGYNVLKSLDFLRIKYKKYKIIVYQLEHLFNGSQWVNKQSYDILKSADEIWDYDEGNILWMRNNYNFNAEFKPLVYTESLKNIPTLIESECDIDVLFYGYLHERRAKFLINLQQKAGAKISIYDLYGVWGEKLDNYIKRSKLIMNMHSSEYARQEQPRIYYPVINGRCVLSEESPINYFGDAIIEVSYENLLDKIFELLKTGEWLDIAYQASNRYKFQSEKYKNLISVI